MKRKSTIIACFFAALATALPAVAADAKPTFTFASRKDPGRTQRVVAQLEVGGETKYSVDGKPQTEKMSVVCNLDYFEKVLSIPADNESPRRSVRNYQKVAVMIKVGDHQFEPALRPEHRLIAVEAGKQSAVLFSPSGSLTRAELDAIDIQGNSLLLDRLLPDKPVSVGDRWQLPDELLAALLGLDEVAKSDVQSTLKEVTSTVARFELAGTIEGAVFGVTTKIELKGKYRFDLRNQSVDWLGMLIKEDHDSSFVDDGIDVVSKLQVIVTPAEEPASLADAALAKLTLKPTPEMTHLTFECPDGSWRCQHDRRWYVHHQRAKNSAVVLRLLDRGMLSGQCNVSSLPSREPEKLVSLEEFQDDVRRALGKAFGEFIEAGQSANEANYRVYRVVVHGTSSDIAMRWIYYLVADPQGRQVALTFAVDQPLLDRFADADKAMVSSLRFTESKEKQRESASEAEK